jgi:V/A-type H+/Na+-transporting ATPase subunit K
MSKLPYWTLGAILTAIVGTILLNASAMGAETPPAVAPGDQSLAYRSMALGLAAAFAIAVSVLGAGYAVGRIGSAALGAISEKPELLTRAILFVALAEGLAVLGFAVAMMLMQKI